MRWRGTCAVDFHCRSSAPLDPNIERESTRPLDAYDIFPYESIAFPETHPDHLAVLGRLLGLPTATPATAQVLEIGCASGGNVIPMAYHLPAARFLGIDLSASQVATGQRLVQQLELNNVELHQGDILDLGPELGEFHYIIAHGVYSWVPQQVREHLLALAPRLLAPNGLFYVSYNTLPGWRMHGMLRDILMYACPSAETPQGRIATARNALERLRNSLKGLDALSARYLREEIARLEHVHPSYLLFEYLAEHNQPFLFSDFAADADRAGLRYLCDTELRTLFPSSYGETISEALAPIEDGLELEQWLDFVTNRNFRQSVLCRADADLAEGIAIDLDQFAQLAFRCDLRPSEKPDLRRVRDTRFRSASCNDLRISHPLTKAVVLHLSARFPNCLLLAELMPSARQDVEAAGGGTLANDMDACLQELFSLYAHGSIAAQPSTLHVSPPQLDQPALSPLARVQLEAGAVQVTTIHHGNLDLDAFAARVMHHLDGTRTEDEIARALVDELQSGHLQPPQHLRLKRWSDNKAKERVGKAIEALIVLFARHGILSSRPNPEA